MATNSFDTFEAIAPKVTPPVVTFVVIPGKADFNFADKFN